MTTHTLVSTAQLADVQEWLDSYQDQRKIMLDAHNPDTVRLQAAATGWRCLHEALAEFTAAASWAETEQGAE
jgi:hypothetical protein